MTSYWQKLAWILIALFVSSSAWSKNSDLRDGLGRKWPLDYKPQKVASSFLAGDEILLEILKNSPDKIIATSTVSDDKMFSNITLKLKEIPHRIGNNPELIAKIKPDVVFVASWNRPDFLGSLSKLNIKTFTLSQFDSISDIEKNILLMGQVLHFEEDSILLVKKMQKDMPQLPPKNLKILRYDSSGFMIGRRTIFDSIIQRLGLRNAVEHNGWPKLSPEVIAKMNPDIIVVPGENSDKQIALENLRHSQGWKELAAVKEERVIMVPERLLSSASHYVIETYEAILAKITPLKPKR